VQVIKELLEHEADTGAKDIDGGTPLHWAILQGLLAVVNDLLSPNDSNDAATSILGKRKNRRGADTEAKSNERSTPLHCASLRGHLPVVKAFLSGGANLLTANNYGQRHIDKATRRGGNSEVVKCLLGHFYSTICGVPPLHELLEDLTCNTDVVAGFPPLRLALLCNVLDTDHVVEIVEYLVGRDPELLSARDQDGSLPFHAACRRGASFAIAQSLGEPL
jgi:ankyrin repeat protein